MNPYLDKESLMKQTDIISMKPLFREYLDEDFISGRRSGEITSDNQTSLYSCVQYRDK